MESARSDPRVGYDRVMAAASREPLVIPEWDTAGVIPPIAPGASGASPHRAPYRATMIEVVRRYGRTQERRAVLRGLLELRRRLAEVGLADGFQWLDGSFVEDVETLRSRAPADVDVVTFAHLGDDAEQQRRFAEYAYLFDPRETKARFAVDAYYRNLDEPMNDESVRWVTYWYSMWAHRREDRMWKGFIEVPLSAAEDEQAFEVLETLAAEQGDGATTEGER